MLVDSLGATLGFLLFLVRIF
uniref:Uncharacterized protein n=1 Tax=Rhizophora mucronata TaxID=61149 RepID=A0A2P2JKH6_RHIMU